MNDIILFLFFRIVSKILVSSYLRFFLGLIGCRENGFIISRNLVLYFLLYIYSFK